MNLIFKPETHEYFIDGNKIPNVTAILDTIFQPYRNVRPDDLERGRQRGNAVHIGTHLYDFNDLGHLPEWLNPYVEEWALFKKEYQVKILESEQKVYSKKHGYAGTLDRFALVRGERCILDIKTGILQDTVKLQTAAYQQAWNEMYPKNKALTRWSVLLSGTGQYKARQYKDRSDISTFICTYQVYKFMKKAT